MGIDLDDRVRRALELARDRGRASASAKLLAALGSRANGLASVDATSAEVFVAFADEVDVRGHATLDSAPPRGVPTIVVLDDDGRLVLSSDVGVPSEVAWIVFRRGVLRLDGGRFVLVEVEEDVSAREVRDEVAVPMYADATLVAFR